MLGRTACLAVLGIGIVACQDSAAQFVFEARVVDGDGGNPIAQTDATTLRIGVREGDLPAREQEYPIADGKFEAILELAAFTRLTRVRVEMLGPTTALSSAPPAFVPSATRGFLRVVAAAPSSCVPVTFDSLQAPRSFFGMTPSGTFALVVGGASAEDVQVEFFDALEWESRTFGEELSLANLGATRSVSIDEGKILVVPENAAPFIFDMLDASQRITQTVLHDGAGPRSGLVSVPGVGAMVIGGEVSGEPQTAVSIVGPDGGVTTRSLGTPRALPTAVALGANVLVAGGNREGTAEILRDGIAVGRPVSGLVDGVRNAGILIGDGAGRALYLGGTNSTAEIRRDTVRFEDCPAACSTLDGPTWETARLGTAHADGSALIVAGEGSRLVEEVRWDGNQVEIGQLFELQAPRAGAGALVLESGMLIVGGGEDGTTIQDDFELCAPPVLAPLEP